MKKWEQGCYTLVHDTDTEGLEFALDLVLYVGCQGKFLYFIESGDGCINIFKFYKWFHLICASILNKHDFVIVNICKAPFSYLYPPANCVCGRVYCFNVRPTDRVSVTFCFLNILKNH